MKNLVVIKSIITFFLAVSFLTNLFLHNSWLNWLNIFLLVLILIPSLFEVQDTARNVGYFLFAVGFGLLFLYDAPFSIWVEGINRNLYLVVMFTVVPLLAIPIRQGEYMEALKGVFRRYANKDSEFTLYVGMISFFLGVMVNVGAITLMHQICQASDKSKNTKLLATAITRGFTASIIWAPGYATVALAIELTGAKWTSMFPYGLLIGLTALMYGWLIKRFQESSAYIQKCKVTSSISLNEACCDIQNTKEITHISGQHIEEINWKKIIELCFFSILLIVSIVLISHWTGIKTVIVVALVSLFFPVIWLLIIGKLNTFLDEFRTSYFKLSLPKLKNEIVLFVGAGVISTSIMFSHLGDFIPKFLLGIGGDNLIFLSSAVVFITIALGVIGIHPIVFVTLIGSTIQASMYGISPSLLALILTCSWSIATTLSPSSANVISMAGLVEHSLIEVGPKWNTKYVITLAIVAIIMINLIHLLGLL